MDAMGMNQDNARECSIVDKEPNTNATKFFYFSKDYKEPL